MHGSSKYKIVGILTVLSVLLAGGIWYVVYMRASHARTPHDNMTSGDGAALNGGSDIVAATGVTVTGMDAVTLPVRLPEGVSLCVEAVYPADGETVTAGDKCIKFTDDSIDRARAELEKVVQSADFAYRSKIISNGESSIQAQYARELALLEAESAPQIYQDTLTGLEMQLVRAESVYQEAREAYNAYLYAVENNTFYDDFQIEQLKKAYEDAYDLYASRKAYWEMTEEERSRLSASGRDDYQWILQTLALLKEEAAESREEYELALQSCQNEIASAEFKLHKLLNQLEQAEQDLTEAQIALQKGILSAKTTCELAVAKGQMAENDWRASQIQLENELSRLSDARDEAVKTKASFEQLVGDGCFYTDNTGTIAMIMAKEGQSLAGGDIILAYSNPERRFVSVSVSGEDAAKLSVGERAAVTVTDCGSYVGVVEAICPINSSDNNVSIYNTVLVSLQGDVRAIKPDLTAAVIFGETVQPDAVQDDNTRSKASAIGPLSQMYDLDFSVQDGGADSKYLEAAELYAEAGQRIEKGDAVCRFTQDSVDAVRKALTRAQSEASAELMKAQINYHLGVLEAGLSHNESQLDMTLAQAVYDNTIAELSSDMMAKILETEQLLSDIYQMQLSLTDDRYRRQQADVTKAYDAAKKQMENARKSFVTNQVDAAKAFQDAKEAYESFITQFEASSQQIADKAEEVRALQVEILQSQNLIEKELIAAKQTLDSSLTAGEVAMAKYTDRVKTLENMLNTAQEELDRAVQNLDAFNAFIGEGTIYAAQSGLIVEVGCQKGDLLADMGKLVSFVADKDMTDLIQVPQEEEDTQ